MKLLIFFVYFILKEILYFCLSHEYYSHNFPQFLAQQQYEYIELLLLLLSHKFFSTIIVMTNNPSKGFSVRYIIQIINYNNILLSALN